METINRVFCRHCGESMAGQERIEMPNGQGPTIEMFACPRESCGRKAGVIFEPDGGMDDKQQTWVERTVAERGAFFPTDWSMNSGPRFGHG